MTQEVPDFIPDSLEDTDKHTEVVDRHHVIAKKRTSTNENVLKSWRSFHQNFTQRTFGIIFMQQVIVYNYDNEFGTYLFITQRVLHGVIQSKK